MLFWLLFWPALALGALLLSLFIHPSDPRCQLPDDLLEDNGALDVVGRPRPGNRLRMDYDPLKIDEGTCCARIYKDMQDSKKK